MFTTFDEDISGNILFEILVYHIENIWTLKTNILEIFLKRIAA